MPDPRIWPINNEIPTATVAPAVSGIVLAANTRRVDAEIINVSDPSEAISLSRGEVAVLGAGITLTARGSSYRIGTSNLFKGDINGISASGIAALSVSEGWN
jgi:hypothetical protein